MAIDARRYGCSRHFNSGRAACDYVEAFPRRAVENALLGVVREELLSPAALAELHAAVRAALASAAGPTRKTRQAQQEALQREIERLVDAVAQVGISDALRARLAAAEAKLAELRDQVATQPELPSLEQLLANYKRQMVVLREALESDADRDRTRALLAQMLGPVVLTRDQVGAWAEIEEPAQRMLVAGSTPVRVVAGARNLSRRRIRVA